MTLCEGCWKVLWLTPPPPPPPVFPWHGVGQNKNFSALLLWINHGIITISKDDEKLLDRPLLYPVVGGEFFSTPSLNNSWNNDNMWKMLKNSWIDPLFFFFFWRWMGENFSAFLLWIIHWIVTICGVAEKFWSWSISQNLPKLPTIFQSINLSFLIVLFSHFYWF